MFAQRTLAALKELAPKLSDRGEKAGQRITLPLLAAGFNGLVPVARTMAAEIAREHPLAELDRQDQIEQAGLRPWRRPGPSRR